MNPITKLLVADEAKQMLDYSRENKNSVSVENFSTVYGIYEGIEGIEPQEIGQNGSKLKLKYESYEVADMIEYIMLLESKKDDQKFFGSLFMDSNKNPINIYSYMFIQRFDRYKDMKKFKVFLYFIDEDINISSDAITENTSYIEDVISKINDIQIETKDQVQEEIKLVAKAPKELEQLGLHLSDHHRVIEENNVNEIIHMDDKWIVNIETTYFNDIVEKILSNKWFVELSIIDMGIKIPTYGFFNKTGSKVEMLIGATKHPNINESGTSVCTGSNMATSVLGISELTYGNLNSPLNSNIWLDNQVAIEVAKAFMKVFHRKIMNLKWSK